MPSSLLHRDDHAHASPLIRGWGWLMMLLLFIVVMTMWLLLYPFNFQSKPFMSYLEERGFSQIHKINLVLNVLLFMPMGLVMGWALKVRLPSRVLWPVLLVMIVASMLSATGEYLQRWLPEPSPGSGVLARTSGNGRTSSLIDLIANICGATLGAVAGVRLSAWLSRCWQHFGAWLAVHRRGRRAFVVLIFVLLVRTAPYDASLETYYLRTKFQYETQPSGAPFSAVRKWLLEETGSSRAEEFRRKAALREMSRAGLSFVLFGMLTFAMLRAAHENIAMGGKRGSAWEVIALGLFLVIATEALHLPIRSRLMDATDPVGGAIGVCVGVMVAMMRPVIVARER